MSLSRWAVVVGMIGLAGTALQADPGDGKGGTSSQPQGTVIGPRSALDIQPIDLNSPGMAQSVPQYDTCHLESGCCVPNCPPLMIGDLFSFRFRQLFLDPVLQTTT